ncbi:hypothetical protein Btru_031206 [Bulinus truncatus]|nr:hypothetical protein Btru_031206 [Bulinus truncatus]
MSSMDDVFSIEGPESFSQQNGDAPQSYNKNRATLEKIKSVHDNPFFIQLGIKHTVPAHSRTIVKSESSVKEQEQKLDEDDTEITYRPGSGFVHRLLDKYKSLTARGENVSHLKRATSLDELSAENDVKSKSVSFKEPAHNGSVAVFVEKPSHLSTSRLSQAHKARSVDGLNDAHYKPHPSYGHSISASHRMSGSKWNRDKVSHSSHKSEAPDVDLAREDIIIIEKTPPIQTHKDTSGLESDDNTSKPLHQHEDLPKDELPKPNTVLNVRTIFESASASSTNELLTRRRKPDSGAFSPLSTTPPNLSLNTDLGPLSPVVSPHANNSERSNIKSPSPVTSPRPLHQELHAKPVLLPHSLSSNSSESSKPSSDTLMSNAGSTSYNNSSSSFTHHTDSVSDSKATILERSSYFGSAKSSTGTRPTPTPRSTASVKPTIVQKPSASVKPVPLSAPASAATSYKKSSPVVPVAPFKDKQEDSKDDGQPVLIFSKSKLSPRREKPKRVKNYDPVSEGQNDFVKEKNEKVINASDTANIIQKEDKVINNKVFSQSKIFKTPDEKKDAAPVTLIKATPSVKQRAAPKPPEATSNQKTLVAPLVMGSKSEENLEAFDSSHAVNDTSHTAVSVVATKDITNTPHEKPSGHQPVKGIPSIIAQRLKKQNSDPSQMATDVISSSDSIDGNRKTKLAFDESGTDSDAPSPRKRVTPTSIVQTSVDNTTTKDSVSSEIENEIAAVRKKMESSRSKSGNVSQIFDSSQLAKKRKENQKQRASQSSVPRLDLSGINDEPDYHPVQMEIKPCNIIFIGENAKTERSLLVKSRCVKLVLSVITLGNFCLSPYKCAVFLDMV